MRGALSDSSSRVGGGSLVQPQAPSSNIESGINACGRTSFELLQKARDIKLRLTNGGQPGCDVANKEPSLMEKPWHTHDTLMDLTRELSEISSILFGNA